MNNVTMIVRRMFFGLLVVLFFVLLAVGLAFLFGDGYRRLTFTRAVSPSGIYTVELREVPSRDVRGRAVVVDDVMRFVGFGRPSELYKCSFRINSFRDPVYEWRIPNCGLQSGPTVSFIDDEHYEVFAGNRLVFRGGPRSASRPGEE